MPNFDLTEHGGYGQAKADQLVTLRNLCDLVKAERPVIAEIGPWTGLTTSIFASYAREKGGLVHAIDWFKGTEKTMLIDIAGRCDILSVFSDNMRELNLMGSINILKMRSEEAVKHFKDQSLDLVFIDGDHRYEAIKQDIEMWYPKVKNGGVFSGHDCEKRMSEVDPAILLENKHIDWIPDFHPGVILAVGEKFPNCNIENDVWWVVK